MGQRVQPVVGHPAALTGCKRSRDHLWVEEMRRHESCLKKGKVGRYNFKASKEGSEELQREGKTGDHVTMRLHTLEHRSDRFQTASIITTEWFAYRANWYL